MLKGRSRRTRSHERDLPGVASALRAFTLDICRPKAIMVMVIWPVQAGMLMTDRKQFQIEPPAWKWYWFYFTNNSYVLPLCVID